MYISVNFGSAISNASSGNGHSALNSPEQYEKGIGLQIQHCTVFIFIYLFFDAVECVLHETALNKKSAQENHMF